MNFWSLKLTFRSADLMTSLLEEREVEKSSETEKSSEDDDVLCGETTKELPFSSKGNSTSWEVNFVFFDDKLAFEASASTAAAASSSIFTIFPAILLVLFVQSSISLCLCDFLLLFGFSVRERGWGGSAEVGLKRGILRMMMR